MPVLYYDILFCFVFVSVSAIAVIMRRRLFHNERPAYRKILTGLFILIVVSLLQLAGRQGLLNELIFLNVSANRQIAEATGIVLGLVFLLVGLGEWLPKAVLTRREGSRLSRRYHCLKMVENAVADNLDLTRTYEKVISYLHTYLGIPECTAYTYASRLKELRPVAASGSHVASSSQPDNIQLEDSPLKSVLDKRRTACLDNSENFLTGETNTVFVTPIADESRLYGALVCQGTDLAGETDMMDFLDTVGSTLARFSVHRVTATARRHYQTLDKAFEKFTSLVNRTSSARELMPRAFPLLQELVGAEYLSLAVLDPSGENMVRYTVGTSGRLLLERGVSLSTIGTDIYEMYRNPSPWITTVTKAHESDSLSSLFVSCGMRAKLDCPVMAGSKVQAVVTLGHTSPDHFTAMHRDRAARICHGIAAVIQKERLNEDIDRREEQILNLQLLERDLLDNFTLSETLDNACEMVTNRMKSTMARISLLDQKGNNLISQACRSIREPDCDLRPQSAIPLSLLPWHRMMIDSKKLMLINQDDPESMMPRQESDAALMPNLNSSILVPIMVNRNVVGSLSIAEARNWRRRSFTAADLLYAKDVAAKCATAIRLKQAQKQISETRRSINTMTIGKEKGWDETRMRLTDPLTTIMGSVELLKMRAPENNGEYQRFYDMIANSVERIRSATEDYAATLAPPAADEELAQLVGVPEKSTSTR